MLATNAFQRDQPVVSSIDPLYKEWGRFFPFCNAFSTHQALAHPNQSYS